MSLRRAWFLLSRWTARLQLCPTAQPDSIVFLLEKVPSRQVKAAASCHWGLCTLCKCLSSAKTSQNFNTEGSDSKWHMHPLSLCMQSHLLCLYPKEAGWMWQGAVFGNTCKGGENNSACVRWVVGNQGNLSLKEWPFALFHSSSLSVQLKSEQKRAPGPGSGT